MPMPILADAPSMSLIRDLVIKNKTRSKMKARRAMAAENPETQVLQHAIDISLTCASSPNTAEMAARMRAIACRKRAYVIHLTTTLGICMGSLFPTMPLMSTVWR